MVRCYYELCFVNVLRKIRAVGKGMPSYIIDIKIDVIEAGDS